MVLHLLGKKSWNVYNKDNVDRVRRDEAAAQAREEENERRMQEEDAIRRTAILRGEAPPPVRDPSPKVTASRGVPTYDRKRRRLRGEDDTDREIREAREDADAGSAARTTLSGRENQRDKDVAITDHAGHIQLFAAPSEKDILASSRNADAEAEKAKKALEFENQYTMKFSNAAGFKQGLAAPWYADSKQDQREEISKDAWGNADLSRKNREQTRMSANDPMAFMQKAQSQLKRAETDKLAWKAAKEKELRELEMSQREERRKRKEHRHKHRRRERSKSVDSLDGFSLDRPEDRHSRDKERRRDRDDHHGRHRSRSRERRHSSRPRSHRRRSRSPV